MRVTAFDRRRRTQHRLGSRAAVQTALEAALSPEYVVFRLKVTKYLCSPMNTCESSYKKYSVACSIRNKTSGEPCTEVTAAMPRVFALWELESDPNSLCHHHRPFRAAVQSNKVYLPRMSPSPFANIVARQINAIRWASDGNATVKRAIVMKSGAGALLAPSSRRAAVEQTWADSAGAARDETGCALRTSTPLANPKAAP